MSDDRDDVVDKSKRTRLTFDMLLEGELRERLKRLAELRYRISTKLYVGIGTSVMLTIAAALVGWFSFNRVGEVQNRVNEGSVPEMVAAFGVAQLSGELVAAAPSLAAATPEDLQLVSSSIDETYAAFESRLTSLEGTGSREVQHQRLRTLSASLRDNIESIKTGKAELFELATRRADLQLELDELRAELDGIVIPAIDDHFFYIVTGYEDIDVPPAPRSEHLSEPELNHYRYLAELQADANIATQLLASAFALSDGSSIEPLRERFESAEGRIERSLSALRESPVRDQLDLSFVRLFTLGGEDSGFDLRSRELQILGEQETLLALNRDIAVDLLAHVNVLVSTAQANVQDATGASEEAIITGRALLLAISAIGVGGAVLIVVRVGRVLMRRLARLSAWMRRMAGGDLEATEEFEGRDEVADMAAALEVFRQHALEVQRLNLVEMLADELKDKNEQLEEVLNDLQRAQDQIVMREKLAALGELTAGVAHEIKNPLNFVKNFSEASEELLEELREALDGFGDQISDDDKSYVVEISDDLVGNLKRIRSHGERANRIVHDMLQMGRDTGEWQQSDINGLLEQHARLAYHAARANDSEFQIDLKFDLDPDVGRIEVIPRDLSRVFLNMVGNAGDATDEKRRKVLAGEIQLEPPGTAYEPTLWLSSRRGEDRIEIRIKDNGMGIPPEVADKIFNPFFTTKPTDRGTGLGLAISSDIIRQHGGTIRVESEPGRSTEMIIGLPLQPPPAARGETESVEIESVAESEQVEV